MKNNSDLCRDSHSELKPLSAKVVLGEITVLKEPRLFGDWVLWLEQRPSENGRTTALIRPWGRSDITAQELTPAPTNLRTKVHTYGGAPLATYFEKDKLFAAWIDDTDGSLWSQSWQVSSKAKNKLILGSNNFTLQDVFLLKAIIC